MIKPLIIITLLSAGVSCGVSFSTARAMESNCFIVDVEKGEYRKGEQLYWVNRVCYGGRSTNESEYTTYSSHITVERINELADGNFYTTEPVYFAAPMPPIPSGRKIATP